MGDVWASARRDKMASRWACSRARTSWSRERGQAAAPTRKWRTTSSHDSATFVDVVQKIHSQRHALTISFSEKDKFFVVITVSVDGKEAWSVRPMDFEEAPGRCDVRTNTVVPVLCLRVGTPRRCCTSRILSCNGVHALFLQSLVPPLSPSLSR